MRDHIGVDGSIEEYLFGFVLLNDWSARDIQMWESTPLGPFNGKNFCTTISPWVVTMEALEPFRTRPIPSKPVLRYLQENVQKSVYDIPIDVSLLVGSERYAVSRCNTRNVIFSFPQMLAHHTAGGCRTYGGDLIATGTLSGTSRSQLGCLLEATYNGASPYEMVSIGAGQDGNPKKSISRRFLEDGDTIEFRAQADDGSGLGKVGFGVCSGQVLPAQKYELD